MSVVCPECDNPLDIDTDDVEEGEIIQCDECGTDLEIVSSDPLELAAVDEPLELHPAASRIDPTAALAAAIAFDARKVRPSHAAPRGKGALGILARQVVILANQL